MSDEINSCVDCDGNSLQKMDFVEAVQDINTHIKKGLIAQVVGFRPDQSVDVTIGRAGFSLPTKFLRKIKVIR